MSVCWRDLYVAKYLLGGQKFICLGAVSGDLTALDAVTRRSQLCFSHKRKPCMFQIFGV